MKLEALLSGLQNPQPAVRLDIVRVLGMVDEVGALAALREHYQAEGDPVVRSAIAWAGKRLYQAQQAGYSTQAEIFRFFGVDREIEATPDAAEAELMEKLERDLESTLQNRQQRSNVKQAGIAAATGLGVGLVAGGMMGLGTMMGGMKQGASAASSNLGSSDRPDPGSKRTPAMKPSTTDFKVWLRRLLESSNDAQREQAIIEIQQLNNPAALPHLAAVFVSDNSPKIRESAQRFGKILYWSSVYWDMEQSGALEAEIKRRLEELGKRTEKPAIPSPNQADSGTAPRAASEPPPPSSQVDVGDILRKAREGRSKRKRGR